MRGRRSAITGVELIARWCNASRAVARLHPIVG